MPHELVVAPGKSVRFRIERDSGAVLDEVFLAPTPGGGFHEEARQIRIPPTSRYTANVWVNRVTSVYFDRTTNKGPDPDEVNQSLVSLGVFPLPPGEELRDGDRIDVYREATCASQSGRRPDARTRPAAVSVAPRAGMTSRCIVWFRADNSRSGQANEIGPWCCQLLWKKFGNSSHSPV